MSFTPPIQHISRSSSSYNPAANDTNNSPTATRSQFPPAIGHPQLPQDKIAMWIQQIKSQSALITHDPSSDRQRIAKVLDELRTKTEFSLEDEILVEVLSFIPNFAIPKNIDTLTKRDMLITEFEERIHDPELCAILASRLRDFERLLPFLRASMEYEDVVKKNGEIKIKPNTPQEIIRYKAQVYNLLSANENLSKFVQPRDVENREMIKILSIVDDKELFSKVKEPLKAIEPILENFDPLVDKIRCYYFKLYSHLLIGKKIIQDRVLKEGTGFIDKLMSQSTINGEDIEKLRLIDRKQYDALSSHISDESKLKEFINKAPIEIRATLLNAIESLPGEINRFECQSQGTFAIEQLLFDNPDRTTMINIELGRRLAYSFIVAVLMAQEEGVYNFYHIMPSEWYADKDKIKYLIDDFQEFPQDMIQNLEPEMKKAFCDEVIRFFSEPPKPKTDRHILEQLVDKGSICAFENMSPKAFDALLEFIYTGNIVDLSLESFQEIGANAAALSIFTDVLNIIETGKQITYTPDVTFITEEGKAIPGVRALLACGSDYFFAMFQKHSQESTLDQIQLPFPQYILQPIVDYLTYGRIDRHAENEDISVVVSKLRHAHMFQLDGMYKYYENIVIKYLRTMQSPPSYKFLLDLKSFAENVKALDLSKACIVAMSKHSAALQSQIQHANQEPPIFSKENNNDSDQS